MKHGAALCLALACAGCAHPAAPPPPTNAHWHMALTLTPDTPRQLDPTQMTVQILDGVGRPVSGAAVSVSLVMPAMDMGQNQVAAQAHPSGIYAATGRFTMPGRWQATVRADQGTLHQMQSFPVTVR